ncbi:hypothetical protein Anapl_13683 [Anas platyrhynchos]|uniref:Uncharacterized protein n=1 Tax=Anas platyrhynchos TaxID=8839 RepID=R0KLW9_ANAPL|nr:hypothetical protein Anapl_13683 [Anas platyrhynchos]
MRERQGRSRSSLPRLTLSHCQDQKPTSAAPVSHSIQINNTSFCVQQPHNILHLHCKVAFQGLLKLLTLCLGEAVLHPAPSHTRKAVTANPTLSAAFCTLVCASSFSAGSLGELEVQTQGNRKLRKTDKQNHAAQFASADKLLILRKGVTVFVLNTHAQEIIHPLFLERGSPQH